MASSSKSMFAMVPAHSHSRTARSGGGRAGRRPARRRGAHGAASLGRGHEVVDRLGGERPGFGGLCRADRGRRCRSPGRAARRSRSCGMTSRARAPRWARSGRGALCAARRRPARRAAFPRALRRSASGRRSFPCCWPPTGRSRRSGRSRCRAPRGARSGSRSRRCSAAGMPGAAARRSPRPSWSAASQAPRR